MGPGQDGVCGNFNGNHADDTTQGVIQRVGARVRPSDNLLSGRAMIEFTPQMQKMLAAECAAQTQTTAQAFCSPSLANCDRVFEAATTSLNSCRHWMGQLSLAAFAGDAGSYTVFPNVCVPVPSTGLVLSMSSGLLLRESCIHEHDVLAHKGWAPSCRIFGVLGKDNLAPRGGAECTPVAGAVS